VIDVRFHSFCSLESLFYAFQAAASITANASGKLQAGSGNLTSIRAAFS
jgi:hypothetical protein